MIDTKEIDRIKKAVEEKYSNLFKELTEQKQKELEALDIVYKLQKDFSSEPTKTTVTPEGGVAGVVREYIKNTGVEFDLNIIANHIEHENPDMTVSRGNFHAAVRRMLKNGEVELVKAGKGKRAAKYKYVGSKKEENKEKQQKDENKDEQPKKEGFGLLV
ncbi:MAG: hypothetical protein AB1798_19325 [Spirochaetota bacterium]